MGYLTIKETSKSEYIEKRSRFIGVAIPCRTEEEALNHISAIKTEHWDARHNCYAFVVEDGKTSRFSDDGEPHGTAGKPILAVEEIEDYIPYPSKDADGLFALKVVGLSMKNAGILDGDIIVADKNAPCRSGDIVVGMDGDSATVKRLLIKDKKIIFMPENEAFDPIYPEDPMVLGKVIGSYRKY